MVLAERHDSGLIEKIPLSIRVMKSVAMVCLTLPILQRLEGDTLATHIQHHVLLGD